MKFRVLIEQDEDGMYVATVPALPGCISQGQTLTEAKANIQEAIAAYLESLKQHDESIPPPSMDHQRASHMVLRQQVSPFRRLTIPRPQRDSQGHAPFYLAGGRAFGG